MKSILLEILFRSLFALFIGWGLFYPLKGVYSWSMQSTLTCSRSQNICQLSHRGITGLRTEEFLVQNLKSAEVGIGVDSPPLVILKTSRGKKTMTFNPDADGASFQVNAFISNPKQEFLRVEQSNSLGLFDLIIWIVFSILTVGAFFNAFLKHCKFQHHKN
jgi:hypothetical protein